MPKRLASKAGRPNRQTQHVDRTGRLGQQVEQASRRRRQADLGTELHIRQEEVNAIEDFTTALPNAVEP